MAHYTIKPEAKTLHGYFSRDLAPVLTIDPGDTVSYSTLDAGWGSEQIPVEDVIREKSELQKKDPLNGHAMCGPVEIRGAKKGQVLEIHIGEMRPGNYGFNFGGGYYSHNTEYLNLQEHPGAKLLWSVDADQGTASVNIGEKMFTIKTAPFMGVMGMPPDLPGLYSTIPPRFCGGNMDCKELVTGSTLYLPIAVDGGLFSVGDGHAAQGDGEISGTAIECPMERVDLTFGLRSDMSLNFPRANTHAGWITFGFHRLLDEASMIAINGMLDLMTELYGVNRKEAFALASVVVDLRVTQIVNGVNGVHAILRHGVL